MIAGLMIYDCGSLQVEWSSEAVRQARSESRFGVPGRVERTPTMFRLALYFPLLSPFGTRECHEIQPCIRVKGRRTALNRFAVPLPPRPRILIPVTGVAMFNAV